jgi:hypothetical protein
LIWPPERYLLTESTDRLKTEEINEKGSKGWSLERIAIAKGCVSEKTGKPDLMTVSRRVRFHTDLPQAARDAVSDKLFDEGHCAAIIEVVSDVASLHPWLTTEQAQTELIDEVLGKHRGKTSDDPKVKKPAVPNVRKAADRWKELIRAAKDAYTSLADEKNEKDGDRWQQMLVRLLANKDKPARTVAAVTAAHARVVEAKKLAAEEAAAAANLEVARREREAWPEPAEYANATDFLTDASFPASMQFETVTESIAEVAAFTDGLQRVALDFTTRTAYLAFFRPLFNEIRTATDTELLAEPFRRFLDSDRVNERTDDDKTLVLAVRHP